MGAGLLGHLVCRRADLDVDPAARRAAMPLPATRGPDPRRPRPARETPAATMASVHGGVRRWWRRAPGSRTGSRPGRPCRPPRARAFGVRAAGRAAPSKAGTGSPARRGTTTLPTHGLGAVLDRTVAASAIAWRMCSTSSMGHVLVRVHPRPVCAILWDALQFLREALVGPMDSAVPPFSNRGTRSDTSAMMAVWGALRRVASSWAPTAPPPRRPRRPACRPRGR